MESVFRSRRSSRMSLNRRRLRKQLRCRQRLLTSSGRRLRWNRLATIKKLKKWKSADNRLKNRRLRWPDGN